MGVKILFDTLTDEELEQSLREHQAKTEALLQERERRKRVEKENDWEKIIDAINDFANKYGNIYISIEDEDYSYRDFPINFEEIGTLRIELY